MNTILFLDHEPNGALNIILNFFKFQKVYSIPYKVVHFPICEKLYKCLNSQEKVV